MPPVTTQIAVQQKVKTTTKINLAIGMVSAAFIGLALFTNAFLLGPVGWRNSILAASPDTTAPTATVTSPINGQVVKGLVTITAELDDNVAVHKLLFYLDGELRHTEYLPKSNWTYRWQTTAYPNSSYVFMLKVYDKAGNETIVNPIAVRVAN